MSESETESSRYRERILYRESAKSGSELLVRNSMELERTQLGEKQNRE